MREWLSFWLICDPKHSCYTETHRDSSGWIAALHVEFISTFFSLLSSSSLPTPPIPKKNRSFQPPPFSRHLFVSVHV
nr:hypothetical protein CFP56_60623 [Quercus suber]